MNVTDVIVALDLPPSARVDQRVPKKLLVENGAPTAADKRRINDGIEDLHWMAALKPTTIGVPEYRDTVREYLEIAVLSLVLRPIAKDGRLTELVHRAVPYPIVLVAEHQSKLSLSLAHKRWSQGEAGATVLDGDVFVVDLNGVVSPELLELFRESLSLVRQPKSSLFALYQGWIDTVLSLLAATISGTFLIPTSAEQADARRQALQECARLESEMSRIRSAAPKEKQLPRQVEINLELKRLQAAHVAARAKL
jgi:Domain of unknown function (DUF4391)